MTISQPITASYVLILTNHRELNKEKSLEGMRKKEDKEKSWQGEKIAEFKREQRKLGVDAGDSSDDDDAAYYEQEVGEKPDKDLFSKKSGSKAFDGGKRFKSKKVVGRGSGSQRDSRSDKSFDRSDKKKKRKTQVFNSEGVGPNFKKGGGKDKLRGVKSGKVFKKKRK